MSVTVDSSVRIYDDFNRLLFLHDHREPLGENFGHEDFFTARFVISVFYTITVFHSF
jgi:hypothetical protein